ncbi:MAG: DUF3307 domain-containing protein [Verrucomicrobiota bacterium]
MLDSYLQQLAEGDFTSGLIVFFALLIAHSLGDHPLQGDFVAVYKNRHVKVPKELDPQQPSVWFHCLTAHSLIHGGLVWIVLGNPMFAFVEFVLHWIIDAIKSEGWTNIHVDQLLHVLCKAVYVVAIGMQLVPLN